MAWLRVCSQSTWASAVSTGAPSSTSTYCSGASLLPLKLISREVLLLRLPSLMETLKLSLPLTLRALSCQSLLGLKRYWPVLLLRYRVP